MFQRVGERRGGTEAMLVEGGRGRRGGVEADDELGRGSGEKVEGVGVAADGAVVDSRRRKMERLVLVELR
jgi:hypothetical protein